MSDLSIFVCIIFYCIIVSIWHIFQDISKSKKANEKDGTSGLYYVFDRYGREQVDGIKGIVKHNIKILIFMLVVFAVVHFIFFV